MGQTEEVKDPTTWNYSFSSSDLNVGDEIDVKVIEIDSMGRVNLSKVQADIELGRVSQEEYDEAKQSRGGDRDSRGCPPLGAPHGASRGAYADAGSNAEAARFQLWTCVACNCPASRRRLRCGVFELCRESRPA